MMRPASKFTVGAIRRVVHDNRFGAQDGARSESFAFDLSAFFLILSAERPAKVTTGGLSHLSVT